MNSNESRTFWISIISGIFASLLVYTYSQEKKAEYDKDFGTKKNVVIAKVDIMEMQNIDDTMLDVVQKPSNYIEPSAIDDPEQAVGQVAATPIKKGEQILQTKLLHPGPDTGISLQIAPSKRAITLPVDEIRGVAKLIRPSDRIDIYATIDSGKGLNQKREITLLMQDVVVLATGVNIVNNIPRTFEMDSNNKNISIINLTGDTKYSTVTVEVSAKEAQDLIYIVSTSPGNLYFTLRNPNDRQLPPRLPTSSSDTVLGKPNFSLSDSYSPPALTMPPANNSSPSNNNLTPAPRAPQPLPQQLPAKNPRNKNSGGGFRSL